METHNQLLFRDEIMSFDTPRVRSRLDILYLITREFKVDLDINKVLPRVLSAMVASVGAFDASLFLFDEQGHLEKFFSIDNFQEKKQSQATIDAIHKQGLVSWVKKYRQGVLIKDTHGDERWLTDENNPELQQVSCAIAVPLQALDQLIGVLIITATEVGYFDESHLAMVTMIADQAAFAIINARLFEAEQRRHRLAETLASIARTINSTLDLDEVLGLILEHLALIINYDSSSIMLFDEEGETLVVRAAYGFDDIADALKVRLPVNENSPNYQAIAQGKPILIWDVDTEPDWIKSSSSQKVRSWIGAPLIARDKVIGMLTVDSHEVNEYTAENVKDVAAFADQAATAVANALAVTLLQNVEDNYTTLFENSTDMILITNYQGLILNANRKACQLLRRTKEVFIGSDIGFVDRKLKDYLIQQTGRLQAWRDGSIEVEVTNAYREIISLEFKVRQVHYVNKDRVQWVGRDISARKEIENMREDLVHMLVHDLRGPLGNLINTIELLPMLMGSMGLMDDNPRLKNILDMAKRSGQEVGDLVDSMLDVSRLEQGKDVPLHHSLIELEEIIEAVKEQVFQRAVIKKMEFTLNPLPETPPLWIDGSMIRRVLINLLDNAIKYTPHQGRVSLTTTVINDNLYFEVKDNGPGIDLADQERVFDKFSRINQSAGAPSGVGLGLAFCKLAVEAHGGAVSVKSEGIPGKGSAFSFYIPIVTEPKD